MALSHEQAIGKELVIIVESPSLIMIHKAEGSKRTTVQRMGPKAAP